MDFNRAGNGQVSTIKQKGMWSNSVVFYTAVSRPGPALHLLHQSAQR